MNLLYICEFPPSDCRCGGSILIKRLLENWPPESVTVLATAEWMLESRVEQRLRCRHLQLPGLSPISSPRGMGHIRRALNWMHLGCIAAIAASSVKRYKIDGILTILEGRFYLAAASAALLTGTPYIIFVHDDRVRTTERSTWIFRNITRPFTGVVLRNAAHVYAVSPWMQRLLWEQFSAKSEVQWPATEPHCRSKGRIRHAGGELVIVFAGTINYAVEDSLELLVEVITSGLLREQGVGSIKFRVYTRLPERQQRDPRWRHPDITAEGWLPPEKYSEALASADILFLPYSFLPESRYAVETAFPSKTADYLASGKPVVVFGPAYSSLVRYAVEQGFGEVVAKFDGFALASAIAKLAKFPALRESLGRRSLEVFELHHNIHCQRQEFQRMLENISGSLPCG